MSARDDTEVLVVGGGPVGLSLGMDLAKRGIYVTLAEMRAAGEAPTVRCNHVSARTMEIFRRLGIASAVREAGLPPEYPNDVAFRTTATGVEFARISIPCRAERYTAKNGQDTWWPTPEPPHRINQIYLEPVMLARAPTVASLRILRRTSVLDFDDASPLASEQGNPQRPAQYRSGWNGIARHLSARLIPLPTASAPSARARRHRSEGRTRRPMARVATRLWYAHSRRPSAS